MKAEDFEQFVDANRAIENSASRMCLHIGGLLIAIALLCVSLFIETLPQSVAEWIPYIGASIFLLTWSAMPWREWIRRNIFGFAIEIRANEKDIQYSLIPRKDVNAFGTVHGVTSVVYLPLFPERVPSGWCGIYEDKPRHRRSVAFRVTSYELNLRHPEETVLHITDTEGTTLSVPVGDIHDVLKAASIFFRPEEKASISTLFVTTLRSTHEQVASPAA